MTDSLRDKVVSAAVAWADETCRPSATPDSIYNKAIDVRDAVRALQSVEQEGSILAIFKKQLKEGPSLTEILQSENAQPSPPVEPIEVNLPFERVPQCACDRGTGPKITKRQMLECRLRGGPCADGLKTRSAEG